MNDTCKNRKDLIVGLKPLLELNVLIPEGMGEEIETDTARTSFEKPSVIKLA